MKRIIATICITIIIVIPMTTTTVAAPHTQESIPVVVIAKEKESTVIKEAEKERISEYPIAESIWKYLKELGYNDYICAGIIGNIMVEAGGHTLVIIPEAETKSYYGICQWSKRYYPDVIGVSLDAQCDYLRDTIQNEFDTFGFLYKKNFNYEAFLLLENEQEAALAFAECYERCNGDTYSLRQECATITYEYFINLEVV